MATLETLLESFGPTVIQLAAAPRGLEVPFTRVVIHDPTDRPDLGPGDLVLGVGVASDRELAALLEAVGAVSGAAVVAKLGVSAAAERAAEGASVALLSVRPGTSWSQVVLLTSSVLASEGFGASSDRLAGAATGDLFAMANVIADLVDAPITIEDPQSRVIAFSGRQEEADAARATTIMGRQVPSERTKVLRKLGVFQRLLTEREPIYLDSISPDLMPRTAIAIRAGDEVLGSIWAAVKRPLEPARQRALVDAAGFLALHMLRHRVVNDLHSGLHAELMAAVLQGGGLASTAARRLYLTGPAFRVLAVAVDAAPGAGPEERELLLLRCRDLLSLHLSSTHRGAPVTVMGGAAYAIVSISGSPAPALAAVREIVEGFVTRAAAMKISVLAGIGGQVDSPADIPRSWHDADQAVRVLREDRGVGNTVAEIGEVRLSALVLQFADEHRNNPAMTSGPLDRLRAYDQQHHSRFLETLEAYLDVFGDVDRVARMVGVHPNTVRYRIRQLPTVADIHLDQPGERLGLMLQLRLLRRE
ncbi:MAG: PucR family transcriptional regulator [Candidatus Dormibacteria bacterium]